MSFNHNFESHPIDVSKTFGFQITVFPPIKPKYTYLERSFNGADLIFYEDGQGGYHLEKISSPLEAKVILSPNLWEEGTKNTRICEITFTFIGLDYKYNSRKEIANFGEEISSVLSNWKQKIVWFTEDGHVTVWKNGDEL